MSELHQRILQLVARDQVVVSDHGYDELAEDGILVKEVCESAPDGEIVEEYPDYHKGPCVLALQHDRSSRPIHVLWGIPAGAASPAVVVTAYRPDPCRWSEDFVRRKS